MPTRMHLSSKTGSGNRGGRGANRPAGSRCGGSSKRRRSLPGSAKLDMREFESSTTSSNESNSRSSQLTGRKRGGACSQTVVSEESSSLSPVDNLEQTVFTDISSGSDAILRKYESMMMNRMSPSGDRNRWLQQQKQRQKQPEAASSASAQGQHYGERRPHRGHEVRPCSRHRVDLPMPGKGGARNGADNGGGGRGGGVEYGGCKRKGSGGGDGSGSGGNRGGGGRQRFASPSGSCTKSGEPSSEVAYQAAVSPLASASSENSTASIPHRRRREGQTVRVAVQDANTSNRQQATRRRSTMRDLPSQSPPLMNKRRSTGTGANSKYSKNMSPSHWDQTSTDQGDIHDEYANARRSLEVRGKRLGYQGEKSRYPNPAMEDHQQRNTQNGQCRQHRRKPQEPTQSDGIYSGNHVESNVLERHKSLRHLHSLRSRRYNGSAAVQRQKPDDGGDGGELQSDEDSDGNEMSLKHWRNSRPRQQQQLQSQRQPLMRKNKSRANQLRGDESLFDNSRASIYYEDALLSPRAGGSSGRHCQWLPPRSAGWQPCSPAFEDDDDVEVEEPRGGDGGGGGGDSQFKQKLAGRPDRSERVNLYDRLAKPNRRAQRLGSALQSNQSSEEEGVWPPPEQPSVELRRGQCSEPWAGGGRKPKPPVAVESTDHHWNSGRMRETRCRRQTLFSCPYVSLSLQTKTYECDRCAGYLPCTNNLNCNTSQVLPQEDAASQESAATGKFLSSHPRDRRVISSLTWGQKSERAEQPRRRRRDNSVNLIDH